MIFNSVWSLFVLAYIGLVPELLPVAYHKLAPLALAVVTTIFWFSGAIATAVLLGTPDGCSSNHNCRSFQAFIAFGFFLWYVRRDDSSWLVSGGVVSDQVAYAYLESGLGLRGFPCSLASSTKRTRTDRRQQRPLSRHIQVSKWPKRSGTGIVQRLHALRVKNHGERRTDSDFTRPQVERQLGG